MTKMNKKPKAARVAEKAAVKALTPVGTGPLKTKKNPTTTTYEGAPAFEPKLKTELFQLAVSNMVGEQTFYEKADARDARFADLVHRVAVKDPAWMLGFVRFLRGTANMRTASIVAAAEAVKARLDAKAPSVPAYEVPGFSTDRGIDRVIIDAALQRADEPGELLAYWLANHGRNVPKPVKRGLADAAKRLYTEHCVSHDTLVLRADLRWVRADTLVEGDSLVGFDENIGVGFGRGTARFRTSIAEIVGRKDLESFRITTDRGVITVSAGHQFVARKGRNRVWKRADEVTAGDSLLWLGQPWGDAPDTRDVGYAAGLIDGEGWLSGVGGRQRLGFAQNPGFVWDEAVACFKRLGFEVRIDESAAKIKKLHIAGGRYEQMRFLGQVRPERLIGRSAGAWEGGTLTSKGPFTEEGSGLAQVLAVESLGFQPVVTLQTSTRTFIADGYLSHNSLLKYDTASHGVRFGDVLDLVHPTPATPNQGALFKYAIDRRHGHNDGVPDGLPMVLSNGNLRNLVAAGQTHLLTDEAALRAAGMTWEDALSLAGNKVDKAALWEAMIPSMGVMAIIRNLRNFDEAGVSDKAAAGVIARLTDPAQIAKSRQLPFRFYTAYTQAPSDRWKHALGVALDLACANVPELPGRTLVLIDTSASMTNCTISEKSQVTAAQAAAALGIVLAKRCGAEVHGWATGTYRHDLVKGQTAMQGVNAFLKRTGEAGHGTDIRQALRLYNGHDRVFLLSDMQGMGYSFHGTSANPDMGGLIPANVPLYTFVLNGYGRTPIVTGTPNRHALAGFSDSTFKLVPLLEMGESPDWDTLFASN